MGQYGKSDTRFAGIYKITNLSNGKIYVGQSKNVYQRKMEHFTALRNNRHENSEMQKDWNENNRGFRWDVIEICEWNLLNEREKYWIDTLGSMVPNGYNQGWEPYKRKDPKKTRKPHYRKTR